MSTQNVVDKIQNFVEFHLFHRRTRTKRIRCTPWRPMCPPTHGIFQHPMLAPRLINFRRLLRPLHLAVDLELEFPDVAKSTTISVTNTTVVDGLTPTPRATIFGQTACGSVPRIESWRISIQPRTA